MAATATDDKITLETPDSRGRPTSGIRLFRESIDKLKVICMDVVNQRGEPVAIGEWIEAKLGDVIDKDYEAALSRLEQRRRRKKP